MHQYNLFIIKENAYKAYLDKPYSLYKTLESLYYLKGSDLKLGLSIYEQLCELFDIKVLKHYLSFKRDITPIKETFFYRDLKERTKITLNYSHVYIFTNTNFSKCFDIFYCYQKRIFVCDFKNKTYFWLRSYYHNK